mmetsp:Transcript_2325/g.6422  ORF Transcript_2325/g.6422 Transcript_2325/m.6422 type:complete len:213 (+) Transcript_2325:1393-2031(+)
MFGTVDMVQYPKQSITAALQLSRLHLSFRFPTAVQLVLPGLQVGVQLRHVLIQLLLHILHLVPIGFRFVQELLQFQSRSRPVDGILCHLRGIDAFSTATFVVGIGIVLRTGEEAEQSTFGLLRRFFIGGIAEVLERGVVLHGCLTQRRCDRVEQRRSQQDVEDDHATHDQWNVLSPGFGRRSRCFWTDRTDGGVCCCRCVQRLCVRQHCRRG